MKRLILIFLLLFCTYANAQDLARMNPAMISGGKVAAAATCTTVFDDGSANDALNTSAGYKTGMAGQFTATAGTVCAVKLKLCKQCVTNCTETPDRTITAYIWADDGGTCPTCAPTTIVATSTSTVALSALSPCATLTEVTFTGMNAVLSNGTKYWVGFKHSSRPESADTAQMRMGAYEAGFLDSADTTTWAAEAVRPPYFITYK